LGSQQPHSGGPKGKAQQSTRGHILNRWLPAVPFACYPLLLVLLNVRWFRLLSANRAAALDFMQLIARAVFVPAFVFLGGTLLRARLNFPRPYEQPGFTPLVPKETHGKSFPSRHALSVMISLPQKQVSR